MKRHILLRSLLTVLLLWTMISCSMFRPATEKPKETSSIQTEESTSAKETIPSVSDTPLPETETEIEEQTLPVIETENDTEPLPVPTKKVSFIGAGDNIVYYGNVRDAASCAEENGRTYNFAPTYSSVRTLIEEADIAFINQETLMCGHGYAFSYYPRFNGPQDLGFDLQEIGFDVVNIANNHMLDKGADGLTATIDFWNSMDGITLIGGYKSPEDYAEPRIISMEDVQIAFLSYTFMTNGLVLPSTSSLAIPYPDDETVISQLARARELADYIIVSVHWGEENIFTPNEEQRSFASLLAEHGADAIIGHHPHVIQPIEWIDRPDGGKTLCVYSLGNFMAEMSRDYNMLGGFISFDIVVTGETVSTENVLFTPTVYYFTTSFYQNHIYPLADFTEELAASHGLAYYGRTITVQGIRSYLNKTISDEFLPSDLRRNAQQ